MSLTVEVVRGLGDVPGPDIVCRYFVDESVYRQVGRVAIDKATKGLKLTTITLPGMRSHIRPGRIVRIIDTAAEYLAKVKSVQFSVGRDGDGKPFATCSMGLRVMEVV